MRKTSEMYKIAAKYRGEVLNEVAWMEKFLDEYIAKYFTSGNQKLLSEMHLLFLGDNRVTLENKRQIFYYIADNNDKTWYDEYESARTLSDKKGKPEKPTLNKDLVWIIEARNVLAHRIVDTTEEGIHDNDKISFLAYKNEMTKYPMSSSDFGELMFTIKRITAFLHQRTSKM
jgi:hypothetical protein